MASTRELTDEHIELIEPLLPKLSALGLKNRNLTNPLRLFILFIPK